MENKLEDLATLCHRYGVRKLELFGSAADGSEFDPQRSDLDFLVEFEATAAMGPADQYFGLWEDLKLLFGRHVDLVTVRSMRNPYFIKAVNETRQVLYACQDSEAVGRHPRRRSVRD
ncbi:MAG: nucleotidyltransferase domain-containing protein [Planctomycetota bacterium]|nr:nucleotidyltransferase domain-containing protein [Planctomycetota bacterium]